LSGSARSGHFTRNALNLPPVATMIGPVRNLDCAWCGAVHPDALSLGTCVLMRIEGLGKAHAHLGLWVEFRAAMALHLTEIDDAIAGRAPSEESLDELLAFRRTAVAYLETVDKEIAARFPGASWDG
jgi:hypothetical protein